MAAKEAQIKALLTGASPWTTLVTGGTFTWDDMGRLGLTPTVAESLGCYDANGKLKLTAMLTFGTSAEANIITSERQFLQLWLYHDSSYPLIRQALLLAKSLLDRKQTTKTDSQGAPFLRWVDDGREFVADELNGVMACYSRYFVQFVRH
jgi:hypothetical protein